MRVGFLGRLTNPIAWAWFDRLEAACGSVVAIRSESLQDGGLHGGLSIGRLREVPTVELDGSLGLAVDVVFAWWGYKALSEIEAVRHVWPDARIVLCVDTLPDARRWLGEVRELLEFNRRGRRLDGVVVASAAMARSLKHRAPLMVGVPMLVVPVVFGLGAHYDAAKPCPSSPESTGQGPRLLFTGRSDVLFTHDASMRKDALGTTLQRLIDEAGATVFVPPLGEPGELPPGFVVYPRFDNDAMLDGTFASFMHDFDANIVAYNEFNTTIRRRVRNGLSSRLATAVLAPTPWLVSSSSAALCHELWTDAPLGTSGDLSAAHLRNCLLRAEQFRDAWQSTHARLAGDAHDERLRRFLARVLEDRS